MAYVKQNWRPFDDTLSVEENTLRGGVVTAERANHIESGIEITDKDLTVHKSDKVIHVTQADRTKWNGISDVQKVKITTDNGTAYLNVADHETILDRILKEGGGFKTGLASAKVSDSPSNTSATRFTSNMVAATGGSVLAQDAAGNVWSRIISSSKWHTEWQRLAATSQVQMSKITTDDGKPINTITSGDILSVVLANAPGVKSYASTNGASDHPSGVVPYRFTAQMTSTTHGNVIGMTDTGDAYLRAVVGGKWVAEWKKV